MTKNCRAELELVWINEEAPKNGNTQTPLYRPPRLDGISPSEKIAYAKRKEIIERIDGGARVDEITKGFNVSRNFIVWLRNRARV